MEFVLALPEGSVAVRLVSCFADGSIGTFLEGSVVEPRHVMGSSEVELCVEKVVGWSNSVVGIQKKWISCPGFWVLGLAGSSS